MMDWLKRLLGVSPAEKPEPLTPEAQAIPVSASGSGFVYTEEMAREDMARMIRADVAGGFVPHDQVAERAIEMIGADLGAAWVEPEAHRLTQAAIAEHEAAQKTWPDMTDCDRLDAAFAALEASGVVSRQNFTCCGNCGVHEIGDEIDGALNQGRPVHGYTFYHMQDTERAAEGGGLFLNYGAIEPGDEAAVAVGHEIVAALQAKGLETDWDGSISRRIGVTLDWKRRDLGVTAPAFGGGLN